MINLHLAHGARLVTMPRFDLALFLRLCQDYRARQLFVVPPVALALAKHPMVADYDLSATRRMMSAAAPLGADVAAALAHRLGLEVFQGYGMTEMSPVSHVCRPDRRAQARAG